VEMMKKRIKNGLIKSLVIGLLITMLMGTGVPIFGLSEDDRNAKQTFIEALETEVPGLMEKLHIPGISVGIIHDNEITDIKNYGYANKKEHEVVQNNTHFQVGSISKSLTAWGVMKLVEQGKVELDAPVEQYLTKWELPDNKFDKKITIRQLLSHTSGLAEQNYTGYKEYEKLPTIEASLSGEAPYVRSLEIITEPGSEFIYSGGGYTVLQLVVEEVTGTSFNEFMKEEILHPLGMVHSTFEWDEYSQMKMAQGYNLFGYPQAERFYTEKSAAGLYTTVEDLSNFVMGSIYKSDGNNVLSLESLELMHTSEQINGQPIRYGLGHNMFTMLSGDLAISHNGTNVGWNSQYFVLPEKGEGIVILTNSERGNLLISAIFSYWSEWQTGEESTFYAQRQKSNRIFIIAASVLLILLSIQVVFLMHHLRTKKRRFYGRSSKKRPIRLIIKIILPLCIGILWWSGLYLPWYDGGWTIATVLPYEFIWVTWAVSAWCGFFVIKALFPKEKKDKGDDNKHKNGKKSYVKKLMNTAVLQNKNLKLLVLGRMTSLFGTNVQNISLSLYVLAMTKSATAFASVLAVASLPRLVLGPFTGVLVDLFDRKKIIVMLDIASGLVVGSVAICYLVLGELNLPIIYIQAFLLSSISMVFDPAIGTVIPTVVEKEHLAEANSLDSVGRSLASFVAPSIAVFIYYQFGIFAVLCINTVSFIVSAISEMFIQIPAIREKTVFTWQLYKTQLKEGVQYIMQKKELFMLVVVTFFINFSFSPFFLMGILLVCKRFFHGTDLHYGLIQSVMVVATFFGPFLVSKFKSKFIIKRIINALYIDAAIVAIIGLITTGWFTDFETFNVMGFGVFLGLIFALLALVTFGNIMVGTYFHTTIPNEKLGRVDAIVGAIALGAIPLGQMTFGYLYEYFNIGMIIMLQSVLIIIPMIAFAFYIKEDHEKIAIES